MGDIAFVRVLCENHPSLGSALIDGLLAWAAMLGAGTTVGSGLPAALALICKNRAKARNEVASQGLGVGFVIGAALGMMTFVLFAARIVS